MTTQEILEFAQRLNSNYKPDEEHIFIFVSNEDIRKRIMDMISDKPKTKEDVPEEYVKYVASLVECRDESPLIRNLEDIQEMIIGMDNLHKNGEVKWQSKKQLQN